MITAEQAVQIASEGRSSSAPSCVSALGNRGFVVDFKGKDPYANLGVYVDAATGQTYPLGADEYIDIIDQLQLIQKF